MVDQNTFDKFVRDRYEPELAWYDTKSLHNQKWAKIYQVGIIILSAITPVLAALELKWPTITASAFVTIMVGILRYYKFEELWQGYRTTCETLKKEKTLFDAKITPYDKADDAMKMFMTRVDGMISKEHTSWCQLTSTKNKKEDKG